MPEPKCLGLLLCFRDGFGNDFTANIFVTENMFKIIRSNFVLEWASLVAQLVKNVCLQCGRPGFDPWVGKISWRREMLPIPVFWPREFHGLYSPWGHKQLDTIARLSLTHSLTLKELSFPRYF